jgi:hypothetical protein
MIPALFLMAVTAASAFTPFIATDQATGGIVLGVSESSQLGVQYHDDDGKAIGALLPLMTRTDFTALQTQMAVIQNAIADSTAKLAAVASKADAKDAVRDAFEATIKEETAALDTRITKITDQDTAAVLAAHIKTAIDPTSFTEVVAQCEALEESVDTLVTVRPRARAHSPMSSPLPI